MDHSDDNIWTDDSSVFAQLNDLVASEAKNMLESHHNNQSELETLSQNDETATESTEVNNNHVESSTKETGNAKIGIKIPKFKGPNKSYVLQYHEEMAQDFVDYLKEMSNFRADGTGSKQMKFFVLSLVNQK